MSSFQKGFLSVKPNEILPVCNVTSTEDVPVKSPEILPVCHVTSTEDVPVKSPEILPVCHVTSTEDVPVSMSCDIACWVHRSGSCQSCSWRPFLSVKSHLQKSSLPIPSGHIKCPCLSCHAYWGRSCQLGHGRRLCSCMSSYGHIKCSCLSCYALGGHSCQLGHGHRDCSCLVKPSDVVPTCHVWAI